MLKRSFPLQSIDRSNTRSNSNGNSMEKLSNSFRIVTKVNDPRIRSTFPRGLTEGNEIEIEKEGRGAYKY